MGRHKDKVLKASARIADAKELLMQAAIEEKSGGEECHRLASILGEMEEPLALLSETRSQ